MTEAGRRPLPKRATTALCDGFLSWPVPTLTAAVAQSEEAGALGAPLVGVRIPPAALLLSAITPRVVKGVL